MRRTREIVLSIILAVTFVISMPGVVNATEIGDLEHKINCYPAAYYEVLQQYKDIINAYTWQFAKGKTLKPVNIEDITGDGIPELMFCMADSNIWGIEGASLNIYTFDKDKAVSIYREEVVDRNDVAGGHDDFYLFKSKLDNCIYLYYGDHQEFTDESITKLGMKSDNTFGVIGTVADNQISNYKSNGNIAKIYLADWNKTSYGMTFNGAIETLNGYYDNYRGFELGRDNNGFYHACYEDTEEQVLQKKDKYYFEKKDEARTYYDPYLLKKLTNDENELNSISVELNKHGGVCHGIALSMLLNKLGKVDLSEFNANNYYELEPTNIKVKQYINTLYASQLIKKYNEEKMAGSFSYNEWLVNLLTSSINPRDFLEDFVEAMGEAEKEGIPLLFAYRYNSVDENGNPITPGHTVLATGITEDDDYYYIQIYDMNCIYPSTEPGYFDKLQISKDYSEVIYVYGSKTESSANHILNWDFMSYFDTQKVIDAPFSNLYCDDNDYESILSSYKTMTRLITPVKLTNSQNESFNYDPNNASTEIDVLSASPVMDFGDSQYSGGLMVEFPNDSKYTVKPLSEDFKFELYNKESFTNISGKDIDEVTLTNNEVSVNGKGADYEIAVAPKGDLCQLVEMKVDSDDVKYSLNDKGIDISSQSGISSFEINTINDLDPSESKSITITANNMSISAGSSVDKIKVVATNTKGEKQEIEVSVPNKSSKDTGKKDTPSDTKLDKVGTVVTQSSGVYKVIASDAKAKKVTYVKPKNKKVKSVKIPATIKINGVTYQVTEISANAFKNCKKLKSVVIGKNIRKIGKNAFSGCKNLKKITIKSTKLTSKSVGKNAFNKINSKAKIKVPKKKLKAYKKVLKARGVKGKKQKITK